MRPGARLAAQCGGAGNVARIQAVLATVGDGWTGPWNFATPEETEVRLRAARLHRRTGVVVSAAGAVRGPEAFDAFLRMAILGAHLDRLPPGEHDAFIAAVADRLPDHTVDYVRLNFDARRPE